MLKYDAEGKILSVNLDIKNPHSLEALEHREPSELLADLVRKERRVLALLGEVAREIDEARA